MEATRQVAPIPVGAEPAPGSGTSVVRAAGVLLWRGSGPDLQVALVHRPKYDDWSWPKGKLDDGESWPAAATREVLEEAGVQVRLGVPLPSAGYPAGSEDGVRLKVVRYWAAHATRLGPPGRPEVDQVRWLSPKAAGRRLDYRRDRDQLASLVEAERAGALGTWPLVIVRHARAVPRRGWDGDDDRLRPLLPAGLAQAQALVPTLAAYGVRRVLTSGSRRCAGTVEPYAAVIGRRPSVRPALSEEGFAAAPGRVLRLAGKALARGEPTLLCTHRPVLPTLLGWLAERAGSADLAAALQESCGPGLVKGEMLVAHISGVGGQARIRAVERPDTG
jgi:8-oxo-(d)GTP phosphatase